MRGETRKKKHEEEWVNKDAVAIDGEEVTAVATTKVTTPHGGRGGGIET